MKENIDCRVTLKIVEIYGSCLLLIMLFLYQVQFLIQLVIRENYLLYHSAPDKKG